VAVALVALLWLCGSGLAQTAATYVTGWGSQVVYPPTGLNGKFTAIAAGAWHGLALKSDGTVIVWGANIRGQTNVPAGLSGVTAIAAGFDHCLALYRAVAPGFNEPPESRNFGPGQCVTLSISASGTPSFSYQWQLNGTNLVGATWPTLTLSNLTARNAGAYAVVVSNPAGTNRSAAANLSYFGDLKLYGRAAGTVLA
jgi:hypothetical protein